MLRLIFIMFGLLICSAAFSQQKQIDSLLNQLNTSQPDTIRGNLYNDIAHYYMDNNNTLAIQYFFKAIDIRKRYNQSLKLANNYYSVGYCYRQKSDYPKALDNYLRSVNIYLHLKDTQRLLNAYLSVSNVYMDYGDYAKAKEYLNVSEELTRRAKDNNGLVAALDGKGLLFDHLQQYDSALVYHQRAYGLSLKTGGDPYSIIASVTNLGLTYKHQHKNLKAMACFDTALTISNKHKLPADVNANIYNSVAETYAEDGNYKAARQNFDRSLILAKSVGVQDVVIEDYRNLSDMYGNLKDYRQEAVYLKMYYKLKDSLFNADAKNQLTQLDANFKIGQKNDMIREQRREVEKQTGQRNIFLAIALSAALLLLLSVVFYTRIKKSNRLLTEKNNQIIVQNDTLENTLINLKETQLQLIQAEKMASLGELTAGIAHEIQNPLNFVNNFSEVSNELVDEMKDELAKGNYKEVGAIVDDVKNNLAKITQHGRRADAIVKGMLQHSRTSSGNRELTDINELCDEYLRLSYHGLRAKDKNFNADLKTDFDVKLPEILLNSQDIGRVLLNLVNNAFYAVNDKNSSSGGALSYKPEVSIKTKQVDDKVEIKITDNGNGIPQNIADKIFQPFFTTKPTGQGTGLGLSLAYDIVKAHGGEINVKTEQGEGTTFTVILPVFV